MMADVILAAYRVRRLRATCVRLCIKLEHGALYSHTLRDILRRFHGVRVGRYSYGSILKPGLLPRGTLVGNYCSVGTDLIVRRRDHPMERLTQHPFTYNCRLGYVAMDTIRGDEDNPLSIGNDVWVGDRVTIVSGCGSIGNGAVIAAGAVVTHDVPPYAVVAGVPAKLVRMRFDAETILVLEKSRWWNLSLEALLNNKDILLGPPTRELAAKLRRIVSDACDSRA
jgi:acetyltransferase-like isoleucine patch superfamily enzyme